MAAAQIGMMFMTGGSSALLTGAIQQGIMQFGGQAMAQALGKELVSMMGQELIQKLGTEMGLPQSAIDAAQAAFCSEIGDTAGAKRNHREGGNTGFLNSLSKGEVRDSKQFLEVILNGFDASPAQRGEAERAFDVAQSAIEKLMKGLRDEAIGGSTEEKVNKAIAESKGKSLMMQIAMILGAIADGKTLEVRDKAMEIADTSKEYAKKMKGLDGKKQGDDLASVKTEADGVIGKLSAELQALSQEVKTLTEAMTTTIKTLGDSAATSARRG